jgi:hypothetical protein
MMGDIRKYKALIWICSCIFLPVGLVQLFFYMNWKKNSSEQALVKLEKSLILGLTFLFIIIIILCFLFFQYGRNFIPIVGTFY